MGVLTKPGGLLFCTHCILPLSKSGVQLLSLVYSSFVIRPGGLLLAKPGAQFVDVSLGFCIFVSLAFCSLLSKLSLAFSSLVIKPGVLHLCKPGAHSLSVEAWRSVPL